MPLQLPGVDAPTLKTFLRRLREEQAQAPAGNDSLNHLYEQAARALGYTSWGEAQRHLAPEPDPVTLTNAEQDTLRERLSNKLFQDATGLAQHLALFLLHQPERWQQLPGFTTDPIQAFGTLDLALAQFKDFDSVAMVQRGSSGRSYDRLAMALERLLGRDLASSFLDTLKAPAQLVREATRMEPPADFSETWHQVYDSVPLHDKRVFGMHYATFLVSQLFDAPVQVPYWRDGQEHSQAAPPTEAQRVPSKAFMARFAQAARGLDGSDLALVLNLFSDRLDALKGNGLDVGVEIIKAFRKAWGGTEREDQRKRAVEAMSNSNRYSASPLPPSVVVPGLPEALAAAFQVQTGGYQPQKGLPLCHALQATHSLAVYFRSLHAEGQMEHPSTAKPRSRRAP